MIKRFFNSHTKTVTFAAGLLSLSALVSRFLGLIRDGLLAGHFGAGIETDIYFAAFRIPDFVYNFIIVGGITIAFLPLFSEYHAKDEKKSWEMTNNLLNVFSFFLIVASAIFFIFTPWLMKIITPGFSPESLKMTSALTRLMFLSPIFFGISSIFSGILHYFNRFLVYSLAPVLYNVGIIIGILFFAPFFGIIGLGMGVVLGSLLHLAIQIPSVLLCGFKYKPVLNFKSPALKEIFRLMVPRSFSIGAQQLNLFIITGIASTLVAGSIAIFNFSNNIYHIPIGIFGTSFAIASFPVLSRTWAEGKKKEFFEKFCSTFCEILFFVIPASAFIFLLRAELVRVVLGSLGPGKFDWYATKLTAASLGVFSISIIASSLISFVCRVFFSFKDTKTPTLITGLGVLLNIFLSFYLIKNLQGPTAFRDFLVNSLHLEGLDNISVVGLALAFSLAAIFQIILLLIFLYKKVGDFGVKDILKSIKKILIATFLSSLFAYLFRLFINNYLNLQTFKGVFFQGVSVGLAGILVYLFIGYLLKSEELKIMKSSVLKQFSKD